MESKKNFDTLDIFVFLWKKRKPLIIITVLGIIVSVVVSLVLDNQYKATTVLFPTTFISPSTSLLHKNVNQETDPMIIGDEDDLERLIQLLNSDYITNRIIQKYNLVEHYGLSYDDPHLKTKMGKIYQANVSFKKTQYQGVTVSVIDIEPQKAADMANDIASLVDSLIMNMQKQRLEEEYNVALSAYKSEEKFILKLEDSLDIYRQLGIYNYFKEVDRYSEAYGKAIGNNTLTSKGQKFFDEKFELFRKYGKEALGIADYINKLKENLAQLHLNLTQIEQSLNNPISHKYVISYAETPDKKFSPKRSIIVIFSTIGAFVFAIAMILFLDFYAEVRKRIKEEN